ncbi:LppU/SCO3897 family protein [Streptomyces sp. NPDC055721]|uniref:LppU/SCO3897 family protein n=1 Tax=Streptomyces sp. NPDC127132 TaxID=3345374 RepID=UPI00363B6DD9
MTTPSAPHTPEQQPAAFGAPEAPQAPSKGKQILKKVGGVLVAIVAVLAWKFGVPYLTGEAPVHAEAGECVTVTGPDNDPKVDTVDCSAGKADTFKVTKVVEDTFDVNACGKDVTALAQQLESLKFVLCLEEVAAK